MSNDSTINFSMIKEFIDYAYSMGVNCGAFKETRFNSDLFVKRVLDNGDTRYTNFNSNKFERVSYVTAYRRSGSSGEKANTSIVYYEKNQEVMGKEVFMICWPIHLRRKHNFYFDFKDNIIYFRENKWPLPDFIEFNMDQLKSFIEDEYRNSSFSILKKYLPEIVGKKRKNSKDISYEEFKEYMNLIEMIYM